MKQTKQPLMIDNKILSYINKRGLTQKAVANKAGITRQQLNRIIKNENIPSARVAYKLSKILHADFYDLFTYE